MATATAPPCLTEGMESSRFEKRSGKRSSNDFLNIKYTYKKIDYKHKVSNSITGHIHLLALFRITGDKVTTSKTGSWR